MIWTSLPKKIVHFLILLFNLKSFKFRRLFFIVISRMFRTFNYVYSKIRILIFYFCLLEKYIYSFSVCILFHLMICTPFFMMYFLVTTRLSKFDFMLFYCLFVGLLISWTTGANVTIAVTNGTKFTTMTHGTSITTVTHRPNITKSKVCVFPP